MSTIGLFEAKSRLSEIVRKVEKGERFTITVRGRPVAEVIPVEPSSPVPSPGEIEAAYQRLRNPQIEGVAHETIRGWIEEGRP